VPLSAVAAVPDPPLARGLVMTVRGPVDPAALGPTLPHEHVLVDFIGAAQIHAGRWDREEVLRVVAPQLQDLYERGGRTLVECTPAFLGRDPELLRRLAERSGLHLLTNTGYYGAASDKFLPAHAFTESPDQLADRWVREWKEGIDGTGIRPGFIKIGVDPGPLSEVDENLVRAAARTHRRTGLVIASHTGAAVAARAQLRVLREEGVAPEGWIWVHAQHAGDEQALREAGEAGAWLAFDGLAPDTLDHHLALVGCMAQAGLLHRVLVSHDAGWYRPGEPGGGVFRPFDQLWPHFARSLEAAGLGDRVGLLTRDNPARAFAVRPV